MTGCGKCAGRLIEGALAEAVSCRPDFLPVFAQQQLVEMPESVEMPNRRTGLQEGKAWTGERADYIFSF